LPEEIKRLCIVLAGERAAKGWQTADANAMDFFDLKGILSELFKGLRLPAVEFTPGKHPGYHPGKCALIMCGERQLGVMGELHPKVRENYDWGDTFKAPILSAELDVTLLVSMTPDLAQTRNVPVYPPVVEDLAFVLDEELPAARVEELIRQTGGKLLSDVQLFDLFRSEALGEGKVSLAYRLTYQAPDRTLTDSEVNQVRNKIIKRLETELQVKLRS
jgi:phenylalanyl-tRNA synthetase beta chain